MQVDLLAAWARQHVQNGPDVFPSFRPNVKFPDVTVYPLFWLSGHEQASIRSAARDILVALACGKYLPGLMQNVVELMQADVAASAFSE